MKWWGDENGWQKGFWWTNNSCRLKKKNNFPVASKVQQNSHFHQNLPAAFPSNFLTLVSSGSKLHSASWSPSYQPLFRSGNNIRLYPCCSQTVHNSAIWVALQVPQSPHVYAGEQAFLSRAHHILPILVRRVTKERQDNVFRTTTKLNFSIPFLPEIRAPPITSEEESWIWACSLRHDFMSWKRWIVSHERARHCAPMFASLDIDALILKWFWSEPPASANGTKCTFGLLRRESKSPYWCKVSISIFAIWTVTRSRTNLSAKCKWWRDENAKI